MLRSGTFLYKIRNKGMGRSVLRAVTLTFSPMWNLCSLLLRGVKVYRRRYRLDVADLRLTYHPNKHMGQTAACAGGSCKCGLYYIHKHL